jgi:hypothetical protein
MCGLPREKGKSNSYLSLTLLTHMRKSELQNYDFTVCQSSLEARFLLQGKHAKRELCFSAAKRFLVSLTEELFAEFGMASP